ncbi:MAG: phosphoglycerate kinase [Actinobacteria bacterium]|nr:phosphoglycerate kinase [Actinomycetota bacterium]MBM3712613.1 phosphoglycerate kinase [Actinomycetota bacterium]
MFNKKTVEDIDVKDKKVLVRVDYNVPLNLSGNVTDNTRIILSLPTINYLLSKNSRIILISHLGRPKDKVDEKYRLNPAAAELEKLIGKPVKKFNEIYSPQIKDYIDNEMKPGDIVMLENLRFDPGEKKNDTEFAKNLSTLADIYVNDAFGAAHRAHASISGIAGFIPAVAGYLMKKEVEVLETLLENPARPFIAVLGGSKVSDKISVIKNLIGKVNALILGGGMTYTFLKAEGHSVGKSICEDDQIRYAKDMLELAMKNNVKLMLPVDVIIAPEYAENAESRNVKISDIPSQWEGMGIGEKTAEIYKKEILKARTVFWNGPMGVFEFDKFGRATKEVAEAIANSGAVTVVGGGDTIAAIKKYGLSDKFTHVSSGGGASMEFLEGKVLPGVDALLDK